VEAPILSQTAPLVLRDVDHHQHWMRGVSAKQLERELGVTYKTAWRMFNLIRNELMAQDDSPLGGDVEADETYIGGRMRASESRRLEREGRPRSGPNVDGDVHTQTIEGFFSLVKNGIHGVYHSVSARWLQGYLNEYAWRYNNRDDRATMFEPLLVRATVPRG
jgi:hypothetical protein